MGQISRWAEKSQLHLDLIHRPCTEIPIKCHTWSQHEGGLITCVTETLGRSKDINWMYARQKYAMQLQLLFQFYKQLVTMFSLSCQDPGVQSLLLFVITWIRVLTLSNQLQLFMQFVNYYNVYLSLLYCTTMALCIAIPDIVILT